MFYGKVLFKLEKLGRLEQRVEIMAMEPESTVTHPVKRRQIALSKAELGGGTMSVLELGGGVQ